MKNYLFLLLIVSFFSIITTKSYGASCCANTGNANYSGSLITSEVAIVCQYTEKKCRDKGKTGNDIAKCTAAIANGKGFSCYASIKNAKPLNSSEAKKAAAEYCANKAWKKCKNQGGCSITCN